jgi:hypothetical protein
MNYLPPFFINKIALVIAFNILFINVFAQDGTLVDPTNSQVRNNSAALEVYSTNQGFLAPRVSLTQTSLSTPVTSPALGLMVFNTNAVNDVTVGYYYWDGTAWKRLLAGVSNLSGSGTPNYLARWITANTLGVGTTYDNGTNVGIGTTNPGWTLDVNGNSRIGANAGQNTIAALAVSSGQGSATTYRDIDLHGSWAANEGHAITASHAAGASNIVGQIVFEHNSPGSRIKFGRLYHSGDQTTYPMELVSNGSNAILRMNNDAYDYFGPNSTWGAYLQVGGNGRVTTGASVAATNGNLHLDAANGGYATYINYYSANNTYINGGGANVGVGNTIASAKLHVSGGGQIIGTNGTSSNTRTLTILEDGDAQTNFGAYPGAWTSALQIQSNDPARYVWLSPISSGGNARIVTIGSDFEILPGNTLASTFYSSGDVTTARYHNAQYFNSSDNSVGSGVTGVMVKQGDNYFRTGTAAAVATFLNGTTTGPWIPNNGSGDWQIASSSTSTSYSVGSLELRESNFSGAGGTPPHLGMHWGGVVASNITIEGSGRIAIRDNPGTGYENFIARDVVSYSYTGYGNVGGTGSASWHPSGIYSAGYNWLYGGINGGAGSATNFGDVRANIFYDYQNTGYYVDPDGTSELNIFTRGTLARSSLNALQDNSPVTTRAAQGDAYRNGSMGWGTTDFNVMTNWGSGFIDSWSNPANAPGGSTHYTGIQSMHHTSQNSYNFYGFQMVTAGESANRYFLRNSWNVPRPWVEMVHTGNATTLYPNINGDNLGNHSATTTLSMNGNLVSAAGKITFSGVGGNSGQGNDSYAIYQEGGGWNFPYPDLCIGYHTGIKLGAYYGYNGIRFYNNSDFATQTMSVGDGDNNVRVNYNLYVGTYGGMNSTPTNYGSLGLINAKNGYYGLLMGQGTGNPNLMWDGGGNGGVYFENYGWMYYYLAGSRHLNINTSTDLGATLGVAGNIVCTTIRSNGFIEPSDERLKNNIVPISGALDKVKQIQGVTYNWNKELEKNKNLDEGTQYGVIAQELEKILPELVTTDENDENCWKAVNYSHLVPVLIEALKEQQQTIETQKQLITVNTDDITFLKQYTKELEAKINTLAADKNSTGNK